MKTRWVEFFTVESDTVTGKYYTVARSENGQWGCSCPRWIYYREPCKHIARIAVIQASKYSVDLKKTPCSPNESRADWISRALKDIPPTVRPQLQKAISRFAFIEVD